MGAIHNFERAGIYAEDEGKASPRGLKPDSGLDKLRFHLLSVRRSGRSGGRMYSDEGGRGRMTGRRF